MQTFLPFGSFDLSAQCLDNRRLGKQRVECKQIITALYDPSYGWQNHPAVKMWRGHERALGLYTWHICYEWKARGFKDTVMDWLQYVMPAVPTNQNRWTMPPWMWDYDLHRSHQSNLIRKDPVHYRQFFPADVPDDLPYVWPVP